MLVDLDEALLPMIADIKKDYKNSRYLHSDELHYWPEGYELLASAVASAIRRVAQARPRARHSSARGGSVKMEKCRHFESQDGNDQDFFWKNGLEPLSSSPIAICSC